jgi:hypothetical protein
VRGEEELEEGNKIIVRGKGGARCGNFCWGLKG